jgi:uncharacterized protein (TIGR04255 family)
MGDQHFSPAPLPDSQRVIYRKNPLVEVLCQVRFPPILKIAAEPPASFQERIRAEYPLFVEKQPDPIEIPPGVPPQVARAVRESMPSGRPTAYEFGSADEKWKVTLTRNFLALSTNSYNRWEHFQKHLQGPLSALADIYSPAFFTRVGLRYQDLIQRSELGAEDVAWSKLIKPQFAGLLAVPEVMESVEETLGQTLIRFPQFHARVRINCGLVRTNEDNEESFLIDSDFFTEERTAIEDVNNILSYFNRQSGRLFRWCIEDQLHSAMEPEAIA